MATEQKVTFCRICEPLCGMVATVEDGKLTKLRPDPDHPLSRGYACPKGIAMAEVHNDPDRVLHPLKRTADGTFERVSWESALDDIGARLQRLIDARGPSSVAWYMGNPGALSYSHTLWVKGFLDALGSPHYYSAGSQDVNNRFAASALMYGSPLLLPIPDLERTRLLLMVGANPLVSHGSVVSAPRIREQLLDDRARRRGRPAPLGDRAPVRAPADPARHRRLAAAVAAAGDLRGGARRPRSTSSAGPTGADALERAVAAAHRPRRRPSAPASRAERVRELARDFAASRRRGRLRAHRLLPRPLRHARGVPARRAQRRHRQPRPPRRRGLRRPADRARRGRRAAGPRHLRQAPLARRRLPGRDRQPAGDADARRRSRRPARARCARCSSRPATRCCRCPTATRSSARSARST